MNALLILAMMANFTPDTDTACELVDQAIVQAYEGDYLGALESFDAALTAETCIPEE